MGPQRQPCESESAHHTGNLDYSLLDSGSQVALVVSLLGDFNFDGIVSNAVASFGEGVGTSARTQADYDLWRAHVGETPNAGPAHRSAVPRASHVATLFLDASVSWAGGKASRLVPRGNWVPPDEVAVSAAQSREQKTELG